MKLNLSKNVDALREEAVTTIDVITSRKIAELDRFRSIYAVKLEEADAILNDRVDAATPFLKAEAEIRGLGIKDLAVLVREKSDVSARAVFDLEMDRQKAKLAIRHARIPADIEAIKNRYAM